MSNSWLDDVTGVILVGGKSRRMGTDKAFLSFEGRPLFEKVLNVLQETCTRVILVGDRPERFHEYPLPVWPDLYPGSALGGLYTGLMRVETPYIFASSCDIPFPSAAAVRHLASFRHGHDAVVPQDQDGFEPLFSIYSVSCRDLMGSFLKKGSLRIYDLFPALNVKHIPTDELTMIAGDKRAMINVNTPEEIEMVSRKTGIQQPQAVSFVAKSGTGKTTLLEKVIALLKGRGYRIGVIKHDAHRFEIDHPGKDSYRLTAAGADTMLISSPEKLALVKKHAASPPIEEILSCYFTDMDIVLTEGFKMSGLPKIEVHRRERSQTLLCRGEEDDPTLLAVASDEPLNIDVPVLDLNDPVMVADFIEARFLHGVV